MNIMNNEEKIVALRHHFSTKLNAPVDRFGHIKYKKNGRLYRYKFLTNVIRREVQVIHARTKYSPQTKEWVRVQSIGVSRAYDLVFNNTSNPKTFDESVAKDDG